MGILSKILARGRAFRIPNEDQFTTIIRYRAVPQVTALYNGYCWVRTKQYGR